MSTISFESSQLSERHHRFDGGRDGGNHRQLRHASVAGLGVAAAPIGIH
jgi:hypothetical protein